MPADQFPSDAAEDCLHGPGFSVPRRFLHFSFQTSSAPGGQNVNKLATRAVLRVKLSDLAGCIGPGAVHRLRAQESGRITHQDELMFSAQEHRSQSANRRAAEQRLIEILIRARKIPRVRRATKPSRSAVKRRLEGKSRRSGVKKARRRPGPEE